jgi:hypothetical protein
MLAAAQLALSSITASFISTLLHKIQILVQPRFLVQARLTAL